MVNTLAQLPPTQQLRNDARIDYAISGVAAAPKTANATINVWQPVLAVSKSAAPAGGDNVLAASEVVTYTVDIRNTGNAPAYNTQLQDVLPVGMRNATPATAPVYTGSEHVLAVGCPDGPDPRNPARGGQTG